MQSMNHIFQKKKKAYIDVTYSHPLRRTCTPTHTNSQAQACPNCNAVVPTPTHMHPSPMHHMV